MALLVFKHLYWISERKTPRAFLKIIVSLKMKNGLKNLKMFLLSTIYAKQAALVM